MLNDFSLFLMGFIGGFYCHFLWGVWAIDIGYIGNIMGNCASPLGLYRPLG